MREVSIVVWRIGVHEGVLVWIGGLQICDLVPELCRLYRRFRLVHRRIPTSRRHQGEISLPPYAETEIGLMGIGSVDSYSEPGLWIQGWWYLRHQRPRQERGSQRLLQGTHSQSPVRPPPPPSPRKVTDCVCVSRVVGPKLIFSFTLAQSLIPLFGKMLN
jgi:hypothetical protein